MNCGKLLVWQYSLGAFGIACAVFFPLSLCAQERRAVPVETSREAGQGFERAQLDSLELKGFFSREPVTLTGYFGKPREAGSPFPAVVFMHPCDGLVNKNSGELNRKYVTLANRLRNAGIAVLMVDSFNPRGVKDICTTRPKARTITESNRVQDAYGALKYLRERRDVISDKIALVGWGASGTLEAIDRSNNQLSKVGNRGFTAAVAFYPHCASFRPYAPTLVLAGEKDTWNPPNACLALAGEQDKEAAFLQVKIYPDAYHSFDAPAMPLTRRTDVPGVGPVTVGTNPEARADAYIRVQVFLRRHLGIGGTPRTPSETTK